MWGPRILGPDPLRIRAQGPSRGEPLPRRTSYSVPHKMPEGRCKLSIGVGQRKSCQHHNTENCIWQAHTPNHAPLTFPTTPNHSRYGLMGQDCTPKSKIYTRTLKGGKNVSIKGGEKGNKVGFFPPGGWRIPQREKGKGTMLLRRCPRTKIL